MGKTVETELNPYTKKLLKLLENKKTLIDLRMEYRPNLDNILWAGCGVETVKTFTGYATYLTHEMEKAVNGRLG